jgi:hypothetical protein
MLPQVIYLAYLKLYFKLFNKKINKKGILVNENNADVYKTISQAIRNDLNGIKNIFLH